MAYADLSELQARMSRALDDSELPMAQAALEDLSEDARYYGRNWAENAVPSTVRRIVLAAAKRYMDNPDGLVQSRAGDETEVYNEVRDGSAGTAQFTTDEVKRIVAVAMGAALDLGSIPLERYGQSDRISEWVPAGPGKKFPLYSPRDPFA